MHLGADRNANNCIVAAYSRAIGAFAMPAALRFMLRVVAKMKQSIQRQRRFKPNITPTAPVATGRTTPGNKLFTAERCYAISAVTTLNMNFYTINKQLERPYYLSKLPGKIAPPLQKLIATPFAVSGQSASRRRRK